MTIKRPENRAQAMAVLESASASGFLSTITSSIAPVTATSGSGVLIPNVVETTHRGERGWSIFDRLLTRRVPFADFKSALDRRPEDIKTLLTVAAG